MRVSLRGRKGEIAVALLFCSTQTTQTSFPWTEPLSRVVLRWYRCRVERDIWRAYFLVVYITDARDGHVKNYEQIQSEWVASTL